MTLISTIIGDAFRESNILSIVKPPTPNQTTEALRLLEGIFSAVYGGDAGEFLTDWPLGNFGRESPDYNLGYTDERINHPPINKRLIALNETAKTVYLTLNPQDGSRMGIADPFSRLAAFPVTLNANGRTIEGQDDILLNVNGTFREWFYRADLSSWVRISSLTVNDEMPFPAMFDIFFTILLAMRINPRNGRTLDEQSMIVFKQQRRQFIARYLQSQPLEIDDSISWPFMSTQSYDQQREFSSNRAFNRGSYFGGTD